MQDDAPVEAVVLDTDVVSRLQKDQSIGGLAKPIQGRLPAITFVTVAELVQLAESRSWGDPRRARLDSYIDQIAVLPYSVDVAKRWGALAGRARLRGRPRPVHDTWIAATCLVYELPLATLNAKDFEDYVLEGLELVMPTGEAK